MVIYIGFPAGSGPMTKESSAFGTRPDTIAPAAY